MNTRTKQSKHSNVYTIFIEVAHKDTVSLVFTDKEMAKLEYNRVKSQGTYCNRWITKLEVTQPTQIKTHAPKPSTAETRQ
jgi:hypothetical protein